MVRWEPGTRERLQAAALDLYAAKGFDDTTVAEIAQAVGLTERTFFRHFADKREVLFGRQGVFEGGFIDLVVAAGAGESTFDIVSRAVIGSSGFFGTDSLPHSRQRQAVIESHPELRERELQKMATLAAGIAAALRDRGVAEPAATLAAESGVTVFRIAFEQWLASGSAERTLADIEREIFAGLRTLVGESQQA